MSINILEFEKPIAEVAEKIEALQLAASDNPELLPQIDKLKSEQAALTKKIYSKLSTWQKVQVARHPNRPHTLDLLKESLMNLKNCMEIVNLAMMLLWLEE